MGRNRIGCGAVREGKKLTVVVGPGHQAAGFTTLTTVLLLPANG